jgi:Na+/proline symporter
MSKVKQNILDRLVTSFSETDLKKRVWLVTVIGFALCVIIAVSAYFFLNWQFKVTPETAPQSYWKLLWMGK